MRIAILGSRGYPYVYSGYETFVAELASRLIARGHQVTVYCHRSHFDQRPEQVNGIRLVYIPSLERKTLSQFSHSLLSTLHVVLQKKDVILYVNSANGPFGFITKAFRKCTAINVDGLEWLRPKWKGLGAKYFRLASYLSTKLFDEVITDSIRMAEIYQREFHASSTTIAYGADLERSTDPSCLSAWNLTSGEYYLIVGRLVPDNNAGLILDGFLRTTIQKRLVVVGDVPYHDEYASRVQRTTDPRILFTGYVRDPNVLRELYCNCYAYIHGHEFGGTNPTLLKALACGCCILALDTVFSNEVLCGSLHGLYFSKTPESVAEALRTLDQDPLSAAKYRASARSRILEAYTWEKIVDQYEALFFRLAPPSHRGRRLMKNAAASESHYPS